MKGTEKVTRVSVIIEYENGGWKMINVDCIVKSLRLVWLRRIFKRIDGTWKRNLQYIPTKSLRRSFLF